MRLYFKVDNEMLTDYIRYLFPTDQSTPLKVSSASEFGELLIAHARISERPVPKPEGDHVIELELPQNDATQSLANHFLYYTKGDMRRLNMGLRAIFDIDFRTYYLKGLDLEWPKKDIVTAFITSRKLFSTDTYDSLHKRAYRREVAKQNKLTQKLLRKVYYIHESIDSSGLTNNQQND